MNNKLNHKHIANRNVEGELAMKGALSNLSILKKYSLKSHLPTFETLKTCKTRREKILNIMEKHQIVSQTTKERFVSCSKDNLCLLPYCPYCMRKTRMWFANEVAKILNQSDEPCYSATFITKSMQFKQNKLHKLDLKKEINSLRKVFERNLPKAIVAGGVDFSFNTFSKGLKLSSRWQAHYHLIIQGVSRKEVEKAFKAFKKKNRVKSIKLPLVVKEIKRNDNSDLLNCISYSIKSDYYCRSAYIDENSNQTSSKNNFDRYMPELIQFLDSIAIQNRFFFRNIRKHGSRLVSSRKIKDLKKYGFKPHLEA